MNELDSIAAKHIDRYSKRLVAGLRGETYQGATVRVGECREYLILWLGILAKEGKNLTAQEQLELSDAIGDELA